ncbi:MAG: hypothetical protein ACXVWU_13050 [Nocardioides sp.]
MSVQTGVEPPPLPVRPVGWDRLRLSLIVSWAVLAVTGVVVGHRSLTLADLEDGIASGRVHTVQVAGGLARGTTGFATQQVRWRSGLVQYEAEVVQASARAHPRREGAVPGNPVVRSDVGVYLTRAHPGVHVVRRQPSWSGSSMLGWELPRWMGPAALLAMLATFVLLVAGPQPWRATRWAWFWFLGTPVALAFLVLSGPTPLVPAPHPHSRRLTGGWAFLLALALGQLIVT